MSKSETKAGCSVAQDFSQAGEMDDWFTVLDGVMGGKSSGQMMSGADHMMFKGEINTDGGGFSSIRRRLQPGALGDAQALSLKIRSDGRAYSLSFRTDQRYRGRPVSFQKKIPQVSGGEWQTVDVPLSDFRTSVFGRDVPVDAFNADAVQEIGIIIADGIDGPFQLEIAEIACVEG